MTKVFMITQGSYSDYRAVGIFSTKEKAQRVLDALNIYDKNEDIEEYELDELDTLANKFERGYKIYWIEMNYDGEVVKLHQTEDIAIWINNNKNTGKLWGQILAKNDKQAIKIMNDKRAQILASAY